ncbi:MAG: tRNA-uridine aminocarboxypropyltransferase [Bacteriovoracia bacterium]
MIERGTCWKCYRPQNACLCEHLVTLATRTRVVILMHPKEFKREKAATGKLTHACLPNSEIQWDESFLENKRVNELLNDPTKYPVLLYPGDQSLNVSLGEFRVAVLGERELVVFVLDGTWPCAKKMLKLSTNLQNIPRLMFTPTQKSQFVIKQQPHELCLSTIESVQQFLEALSAQGFEEPLEWESLLKPFMAMQQYQIEASRDPTRQRYRKSGGYKTPEERGPLRERSRKLFF